MLSLSGTHRQCRNMCTVICPSENIGVRLPAILSNFGRTKTHVGETGRNYRNVCRNLPGRMSAPGETVRQMLENDRPTSELANTAGGIFSGEQLFGNFRVISPSVPQPASTSPPTSQVCSVHLVPLARSDVRAQACNRLRKDVPEGVRTAATPGRASPRQCGPVSFPPLKEPKRVVSSWLGCDGGALSLASSR